MPRSLAVLLACAALSALAGCGPKRAPQTVHVEHDGPEPFALALAYEEAGPGRRAVTINASTAAETLYVETANVVTLADVDAVAFKTDFDPEGLVEFRLNPSARERLAQATRGHLGGRMVILLHGVIHSAPVVQSPLLDGVFLLSGGRSPAELQELAAKLDAALKR